MAALADPATYRADPETMWERMRPRSGNRRYLGLLRAVAAWREREAQRINIPRQRLVKDETLLEIAATAPEDSAALSRARGISENFARGKSGAGLLAAIKDAKALPESELPEPQRDRAGPSASPALVALLKVLLAARSEEHHVAPRLLASSDELERLAAEPRPDVPALHGWRLEVFGNAALDLKAGRLALGVDGRKVKLIPAG
jgi:ribonuclease D